MILLISCTRMIPLVKKTDSFADAILSLPVEGCGEVEEKCNNYDAGRCLANDAMAQHAITVTAIITMFLSFVNCPNLFITPPMEQSLFHLYHCPVCTTHLPTAVPPRIHKRPGTRSYHLLNIYLSGSHLPSMSGGDRRKYPPLLMPQQRFGGLLFWFILPEHREHP